MTKTSSNLIVVGVGASAGGLQALTALLSNIEPSGRMCLIITQHLSPHHKSVLSELLSKETRLTVTPAKDGCRLKPDHVYIAPPQSDAVLDGQTLKLESHDSRDRPHPSADTLFNSIANNFGIQGIGIVLSGTGSDGTSGIRAIRAAGGLTFAQDPASAEYDGMPISAIRSGGADIVLPPQEIAHHLNVLAQSQEHLSADQLLGITSQAGHSPLRALIAKVARKTGLDFSGYKEATLSRQLIRRMAATQCESTEQYLKYLDSHADEVQHLAQSFLIRVTSFFRDPDSFEALRTHLKRQVERKEPGEEIRIWVPGCSSGEEAYTLAIMLDQILGSRVAEYEVRIFASDIDDEALAMGRKGAYPEYAVRELPNDILHEYFTPCGTQYQIIERIRQKVLFTHHDLAQDPPFVRLDLISCRNLLIYLRKDVQERVLRIFHYALKDDGILFLGNSESVQDVDLLWVEKNRSHKVFIKRSGLKGSPVIAFRSRADIRQSGPATARQSPDTLRQAGEQALLDIYSPPSVLVSARGEILRFFGDCSEVIRLPEGEARFDITTMVHPALRAELRMGMHLIAKEGGTYEGSPCRIVHDGQTRYIKVQVRQHDALIHKDPDLMLVTFESVNEAESTHMLSRTEREEVADGRLLELEQELALTREKMQAVIEELETSNEELQALNEEAQASSEELQASNEELEAANEELQISNEELTTLNDELNRRTREVQLANESLTNILNSLTTPLLVVDQDLRLWRFNQSAQELFRLGPGDIQRNLLSLQTSFEIPGLAKSLHQTLVSGEPLETTFQRGRKHYRIRYTPYRDHLHAGLAVSGVILVLQNDTQQFEADAQMRLSASVFENAMEGMIIADKDYRVVSVNPAMKSITGFSPDELIGQDLRLLGTGNDHPLFSAEVWPALAREGRWSGESEGQRKNGDRFQCLLTLISVKDAKGDILRHIAVISDISDIKNAYEQIQYQANYDLLTGLPNRNLILDRMEQTLSRCRRQGKIFAVMLLDLDNFKHINDALGHSTGDQLLMRTAERLQKCLRESDTAGRLGGDEFVVVLSDVESTATIATVAAKVIDTLSRPHVIEGKQVKSSASVGIALYPMDGENTESLLKNADTAMYDAKKRGRNAFRFFTQEMQEQAIRRQWLEAELANAQPRHQILVYYQPIVDLKARTLVGFEALMRWKHPVKGMLSPAEFIPVAEQSGLMPGLTQHLFEQVARDLSQLREQAGNNVYISVNISAQELLLDDHIEMLVHTLRNADKAGPENFVIEVTESVAMDGSTESIANLRRFRDAGCRIALDDFGTGYSSLSYIKRLPLDIVKIDQSFTRDVPQDPNDAAMIQAILSMTRAFNLTTVVEGVETHEQLHFLLSCGPTYAQGYFFSPPLPLTALAELVESTTHGLEASEVNSPGESEATS